MTPFCRSNSDSLLLELEANRLLRVLIRLETELPEVRYLKDEEVREVWDLARSSYRFEARETSQPEEARMTTEQVRALAAGTTEGEAAVQMLEEATAEMIEDIGRDLVEGDEEYVWPDDADVF